MNNSWVALFCSLVVLLSGCNPLTFDPETKVDEILTQTEAAPYESFCHLQEFKLFGETQVCATYNLVPDEARKEVDSVMRWSVARPNTEWEPIEGGYLRRYSYGSNGDFSVALSNQTMLITYHEPPDTWGEEVVEVLRDQGPQEPVPLRCRERPC